MREVSPHASWGGLLDISGPQEESNRSVGTDHGDSFPLVPRLEQLQQATENSDLGHGPEEGRDGFCLHPKGPHDKAGQLSVSPAPRCGRVMDTHTHVYTRVHAHKSRIHMHTGTHTGFLSYINSSLNPSE